MRKIWPALIILLIGFSFLVHPEKAHASVQDFKISSFTADYYLERTPEKVSTLKVKEEIVAEFPNFDQNHGILRSIPKSYQNHTVSLNVIGVTDQTGKPYQYSTSDSNDNEVLKIGDPNSFVQGKTTYLIEYSLRNVISFPKDNPSANEFYWDVNGTQWPQSVDLVIGRLHIPSSITNDLADEQLCFSGIQGSKDQNCNVTRSQFEDETVITATASNLIGYQNLSFVTKFNSNSFSLGPEIAIQKRNAKLLLIASTGLSILLPLITFVICFRKWKKNGRDPKGRGVIIPEYVAPKGLNVMSSSYILSQKLAPKAVSAGIIEMAVKGYIRLNVTEKKKLIGKSSDYELEVIKDTSGIIQEQRFILNALFNDAPVVGAKVNINQKANKLYTTLESINQDLDIRLTNLGYFKTNPKKIKSQYVMMSIIILIGGLILFIVAPIGLGLLLSSLIIYGFSYIMPSSTILGSETKEYLLGLKEYIKMSEADRLKYLQSPQGAEKIQIDPNDPRQQIKLFEELLPYAMLFGLEKDWAKQFENLYTQPPSWYSGNMNTFNAVYLATSLGDFNNASSIAFSSSSSSSGFGDGGFSGGGGGGGGGGGW